MERKLKEKITEQSTHHLVREKKQEEEETKSINQIIGLKCQERK